MIAGILLKNNSAQPPTLEIVLVGAGWDVVICILNKDLVILAEMICPEHTFRNIGYRQLLSAWLYIRIPGVAFKTYWCLGHTAI